MYFIQRPRFRYIVDGAVYGFAAGIGFAVRENFFYLNGLTTEDAALGLAISRVLSASLMHATASSMVGIAFGRLRRSQGRWAQRAIWPLSGIIVAIIIHLIYNNAVQIEGLKPPYFSSSALGSASAAASSLVSSLIKAWRKKKPTSPKPSAWMSASPVQK